MSGETESHLWDGVGAYGHDEFMRRVDDRLGDDLEVSYSGDEQLCAEEECPQSVVEGVVDVGASSMGNSTGQWPSNDVFLLPYTFPTQAAVTETIAHEETWERYWVPFAEETGVVPLFFGTPFFRQLMIGVDAYDPEDPIRTPADAEGLQVRRTESDVASTALEGWGMSPDVLSWGDTVEGLRTGVVDATETWGAAASAFGMTESIGEVVLTDWSIGYTCWWTTVDWLQNLSEENRETLAELTRELTEDSAHVLEEVVTERIGQTSPPQDDTVYADDDLEVTALEDDEREAWQEPVSPQENPEMYDHIFGYVDDIGVDGREFHDYLWEQARADETATDAEDVSVSAWWNDYVDDL